jgi:hypothetical protein
MAQDFDRNTLTSGAVAASIGSIHRDRVSVREVYQCQSFA